ncbi:condensation domain-containing protein, partial [Legionella oakridgensis]|uniref:condensation domain-containing protein n=1 Tax=Legionella oakridgensis TaxID=29423 RepID=UPI0005644BFB
MSAISNDMQKKRFRLSYAQERFLFIKQYELDTNSHHIPVCVLLSEDVNKLKLIDALQCVVQRHEILRTRFIPDETGAYFQEVSACESLLVEAQVEPKEFFYRVFDLERDIPLRAGFFENYLLIVIHHIAFDGWSVSLLREEIWKHYDAKPVAPLEIQYKDFALWQRKIIESQWGELKKYWQEKLTGIEPSQLPTDYARPFQIDYKGRSMKFDLPFEIQSFSKSHQVPPFVICLTALGLLLSRYTGTEDIVIGTPVANRQHPQLASLIGLFVNTLVIRFNLTGNVGLLDTLHRVHRELIDVQRHQDMPFEKLVDALEVERDPSKHPIFQIMYTVEYVNEVESENFFSNDATQFDLNVSILLTPTQIKGQVKYATSLYKEETIKRFVGHYQRLLTEMLSSPERLISQYTMLSS